MNPRPVLTACFILLTAWLAAPCAMHAQTPSVPASYSIQQGIDYTQGTNGPLKADAYIPNGAGPFPGIVFIHGGAWANGNRDQMAKIVKELANHGYVGFTIDYDVAPVHYPASLHQSLEAVRYLRDHAQQLHLDPTRIAVAGSSAGGELAALVALTPEAKVKAGIILNGVLDLAALGDSSQMVTNYLGGVCSSTPACKAASPVDQVHPGAPPFFVGHGTADKVVPFSEAEAFVAALRAAKAQVEFFTATGAGHTYWASPEFYQKNVEDIERFLSLALRPHGGAGR
ncbi:Acetyl esterase/lipase [Granulicella rosea]|uniref:Acetyl esterase/lipase n=1 Tax=Granulicella rosea TaxID=474952 RepID=A0A239EFW9_9BACT|nr:alpha/beta hydrolase [Granulicella rosea]SNS43527.1 Acetyl esterase/lipase [Granulicella rosea]